MVCFFSAFCLEGVVEERRFRAACKRPEGAKDNSPALQCWEKPGRWNKSRRDDRNKRPTTAPMNAAQTVTGKTSTTVRTLIARLLLFNKPIHHRIPHQVRRQQPLCQNKIMKFLLIKFRSQRRFHRLP